MRLTPGYHRGKGYFTASSLENGCNLLILKESHWLAMFMIGGEATVHGPVLSHTSTSLRVSV